MNTIDNERLAQITYLSPGVHPAGSGEYCLLEAVAWVTGEPHTDHPRCVSPVLGAMGRQLNDILPDGPRQRLIPLTPLLPGTAGDGHDDQRVHVALDWLIRTWLPTWLDLSPACRKDAEQLRALDPIVDFATAKRSRPVVRQAHDSARTAWAAAGDAAGAAATAAGAAATTAAWAVRTVAGAAARAATRAATWDAAITAAAWAAGAAAGDALAPTAAELQRSAVELFERMARVGR